MNNTIAVFSTVVPVSAPLKRVCKRRCPQLEPQAHSTEGKGKIEGIGQRVGLTSAMGHHYLHSNAKLQKVLLFQKTWEQARKSASNSSRSNPLLTCTSGLAKHKICCSNKCWWRHQGPKELQHGLMQGTRDGAMTLSMKVRTTSHLTHTN